MLLSKTRLSLVTRRVILRLVTKVLCFSHMASNSARRVYFRIGHLSNTMEEDTRLPRIDLKGYFKGISDRLEIQVKLMTPVIVHSGEMGDNDHAWFARFLRQYVPQRIGIDTGFVVNCDSDKGSAEFFSANAGPRTQDDSIGPQSDILLLDTHFNAPFCVEESFRVCPVEMVLGTIEVTRSLTTSKLEKDLKKIARVRELAKNRRFAHFDHERPDSRTLFGFLVAFESNVAEDKLHSTIEAIDPELRPHGVLVLNQGLHTWLDKSYKLKDDSLFKFLALLRKLLEQQPLGSADLFAYIPPMAELFPPKHA